MKNIDSNITTLLFFASESSFALSMLFCFCHFGKLTAECFEQTADCIYGISWYDLPLELKRYIFMMIENAQIPQYYSGFDFFILNLETCLKVCFGHFKLNIVINFY